MQRSRGIKHQLRRSHSRHGTYQHERDGSSWVFSVVELHCTPLSMCLFHLEVELASGHMVCTWCICKFREPWPWILGQRMPSHPIDSNQYNLCYDFSIIRARMNRGMAYSKGDENKKNQSPLPERRKRISPVGIPNCLHCWKLKLHCHHTAANLNRVSLRHSQRVDCLHLLPKCIALYQICQGLNIRPAIDAT